MLPEINVILSEAEQTQPDTLNYTQRIIFYKNVKTGVEEVNPQKDDYFLFINS